MAASTITSPEVREDTPVGLLAAITESQAMVVRGEILKFRQAAVWADLHPVESITDAGRQLLGDAVETRHRLPRVWAAVLAGRVPVWKARRACQIVCVRGRSIRKDDDGPRGR